MKPLSPHQISLLLEALAMAASRHESLARAVKFSRRHDEKAGEMRNLRVLLMKTRVARRSGHLPAYAEGVAL